MKQTAITGYSWGPSLRERL